MEKQKRGLREIARGQGWPGLGRDGCGAGGCRDGKEVVVVGVTSGRASAGARAGRERGRSESSWDGDGDGQGEEAVGKDLEWERGDRVLGDACPGSILTPKRCCMGLLPCSKQFLKTVAFFSLKNPASSEQNPNKYRQEAQLGN